MTFALAPVYLGSLYERLDECARNITRAVNKYNVVTLVDSSFLEVFI